MPDSDVDLESMVRAIGKLPRLYDELGDLLDYRRTPSRDGGVSFTRVDAPLPINADASDMRRQIIDALSEMADEVASAANLERRVFGKHPLLTASLVISGVHLIEDPDRYVAYMVELAWVADLVTSGMFSLDG